MIYILIYFYGINNGGKFLKICICKYVNEMIINVFGILSIIEFDFVSI